MECITLIDGINYNNSWYCKWSPLQQLSMFRMEIIIITISVMGCIVTILVTSLMKHIITISDITNGLLLQQLMMLIMKGNHNNLWYYRWTALQQLAISLMECLITIGDVTNETYYCNWWSCWYCTFQHLVILLVDYKQGARYDFWRHDLVPDLRTFSMMNP